MQNPRCLKLRWKLGNTRLLWVQLKLKVAGQVLQLPKRILSLSNRSESAADIINVAESTLSDWTAELGIYRRENDLCNRERCIWSYWDADRLFVLAVPQCQVQYVSEQRVVVRLGF